MPESLKELYKAQIVTGMQIGFPMMMEDDDPKIYEWTVHDISECILPWLDANDERRLHAERTLSQKQAKEAQLVAAARAEAREEMTRNGRGSSPEAMDQETAAAAAAAGSALLSLQQPKEGTSTRSLSTPYAAAVFSPIAVPGTRLSEGGEDNELPEVP